MQGDNSEDEINNFIKGNYAVSYDEILEHTSIPQDELDEILQKLIHDGKIIKRAESIIYYISNDGLTADEFDHAYKVFGNTVVKMKELYISLKLKTKDLENSINRFYINIITIMGVFVAVFSLISINVKEIATIASNPDEQAVKSCIIIEIAALLTIAVMLLLIKLIFKLPKNKN